MKNPITSTVIILLLAVSSLSAATRHVRPGMPIQAVINASAPGDIILFDSGVYAGGLVVSTPVTLQSVNGPQSTVIDGGGRNPCVSGGSLFGFTLTGGYGMLAGGGAYGSTLYNCIITNNRAGDEGGGAEYSTLYNCTLVGNSIGLYGGGACSSTLYNCTLTGNSAWVGGGAYNCTLYNCTITGNSVHINPYGTGAPGACGGACSTLYNCISFNNYANGTCEDCDSPGRQGGDNWWGDPVFVDYANGNLRLQSNSPCINAGNNAYVTATNDLDGNPRIVGGTVDMGAYEYQGNALISPTVVTMSAAAIGATNATLNGTVNPNGWLTTAWFQWGATTNYGNLSSATALGSGITALPLSAALAGLTPGVTYHFRAAATNDYGLAYGSDQNFTTLGPPLVSTLPATGVSLNSAVLNGVVNPNGGPTIAWFQWGATTNYGNLTSVADLGSGTTALPLSAPLTGLTPGTTYHFCTVATNGSGVVYGRDESFTTVAWPPAVSTLPAEGVSTNGATLNGTSNPNGLPTTAWFQWGTTTNYGNLTPAMDMGSGTNALPLSAPLAGLSPGVTYHYRVAATNSNGAGYGSDCSFITLGPPEVWTLAAAAVTATSATLNGRVNPNGYPAAAWFQWGNTTSYGNLTAATDLGNGTSDLPLSAAVAGLTFGASYHFRVAATNSYGMVYGMDQSFTAVKRAGTVVSWGHQSMPLIPSNTRFQALSAGYYHNLALKQDRTVVAWGDDSSGACRVPGGLSGVTAIAAGEGHSLALREDGKVVAWGYNYYGQATVPSGLSGVIAISAGWGHSLALKQDGTVVAWGCIYNGSGPPPATVPDELHGVIAIAAGGEHSLALRQDGTVVAWGFNSYGETNVPPQLSGSRVIAIAAGFGHNLALKQDGTVVAWGWNQYGQTDVPSGLSNVVAIAASYTHSLALKRDGTVVAWGAGRTVNPSNGLDYGQSIVSSGLGGVIGISAGYGNSLALRHDGTFVAWGRDDTGQATVPGNLDGVVAVASAWDHNLALKEDGTVVSWGDDVSSPTNVPAGLGGVVAIAAGPYHNLALKGDGTVVAWGDNESGQSTVPPELSGSRVIGIAAGQLHSLALKEDGTVVAWGFNAEGECTVPSGLSGVVTVAAGYRHSLALKADGTVVAWGSNYGPGESQVPSGLGGVIAIAAGAYHNLALKRDGTVVAWGSNADGETTVPSGLSGVVAIAAGTYHSMALKQDGTVVAWGYNSDGTTDVPNGLNSVIGIAGGYDHSLALVLEGPVITRPPLTQTAEAGSTVLLFGSANGLLPVNYQWFFNGTNSLGIPTTNAFLRLTDIQAAQAGAYAVVASNALGIVSSAPALLSVIPSVERRSVPGLFLTAQRDSVLNLDTTAVMDPIPSWAPLDSIALSNDSQWYFDLSVPLPPQRFYRAWQTGTPGVKPSLDLHLVPAITLTGTTGGSVRLDYINRFGPIDAWVTLDTVMLTNTSQLYFDISAPGQPQRLYRVVQVP